MNVVWLFLAVPRVCLQFVIVVFPDHNHLLILVLVVLYPHFIKDYFGPDSTRSIFFVDRPHIWETVGNFTGNHLGRSGKVWRNRISPTRVGYRKSDRLLFLNMFKNSSRPEPVGPRSSWSSKGSLKVFLSRLPSGAFVYPLELSSTLGSFRILSAAQSAGDLA